MSRAPLIDLAMAYFRRRGYTIDRNAIMEGLSGLPRSFDLVVSRGDERHPVWVKDWKRTVGVNMVINLDRASVDVGLSRPIIVSEKFSGHAKAYANRQAVTLLTKREISRRLR